MSPHIDIQWIGHRKDGSKKGSVWGWFIETGKPDKPAGFCYHTGKRDDDPPCYVFWGRIGKTMHIEQKFITLEFLADAEARRKNFREQDPDKIINRWGKVFDDELRMYVLVLKLKG